MSKLNEIRNCYFLKNKKNIQYFIIFISLLTFAGYVIEKTASLQIIQAQSSNTQIQSNNNINTNTQQASVPTGNNNFILSGPLLIFINTFRKLGSKRYLEFKGTKWKLDRFQG